MLLPTSYEVISDAKREKNVIYGLFVNFIYMTEMLMEGRLRVYITGIQRCLRAVLLAIILFRLYI